MSTQNPTPDATATPRTDVETHRIMWNLGSIISYPGAPWVPARFARTLERELTAAKAEIARLSDATAIDGDERYPCSAGLAFAIQAMKERAEADNAQLRAEVEQERTEGESLASQVSAMSKANDQLRARVAELEQDKARLDWLLSRGVCWRGCNAELMGEGWVVGHETEWLYNVQGQGRARIDKGIAARAGKGAT